MIPAAAILIYLSSLVGLLAGVGWVSSAVNVRPEVRRKAVHVGMGIATLTFPLVFESVFPVIVLALLSSVLLLVLRRFPSPHCCRSIHGVARKSGGEFYFVAGVLVAFALTTAQPAYYLIAVLTLTFADTAAALVGKAVSSDVGKKTGAGSLAFFAVAFACSLFPLSEISSPTPAILTALFFSVTVTSIEALSHRGSDNLTIPVAGSAFFLLPPSIQSVLPVALLALTLTNAQHDRLRIAKTS